MKIKPKKNLIKSANKFPVVGIGASAGGLAAFKNLVGAIPEDSGMAYVLVQHLDPNHESLLPELLQKVSKIPVLEIANDIKVEPDHIYIIPSNKMLLANDGVLELSPRPAPEKNKRNLPIDLFFSSLAIVHQSYSLGVVLSGTGYDGTAGLKAIKDEGGLTFAQDQESAEWKDMPKNAMDAGVVDFILKPGEIPAKILEVVSTIDRNGVEKEDISQEEEEVFRKILSLLRIRKGTDFTYYKQTTIRRRILRRMAINKSKKPTTYLTYLRENPKEQDLLYQDLLIPVTAFFRDVDIFENLCGRVLPMLVQKKKPDESIRLWVAGCSTGQEAYSLVICLKEYLNANPTLKGTRTNSAIKIQLFATDISEPAIAKARKGIYTASELENVSPERLKEFFTKYNGGYQLNKEIREMCVFAVHNFLSDPPFGNMDIVTCRNVLIYLQPYLQKKALATFHYSLNESGYLLLGKSETISSTPQLFSSVSKNDKLFIKKISANTIGKSAIRPSEHRVQAHNDNEHEAEKKHTDFQKIADEILLSHYTPASVVINEAMDIVLFHGKTNNYLGQQSGKPSHNLMKMARGSLAFELRNIIHKVKKGGVAVTKEHISYVVNDIRHIISMEAVPLPNVVEPHYLIVFHPQLVTEEDLALKKKSPSKKDEKDLRILQLEKELERSLEDMRGITEDQEAANEELQSANEELLSGSEELQSLNEEMETSKEELQSTNEEITVINHELVSLNELVTEERNYAEAIVETIHEPLLVLDKNLKIATANHSFYKTFRVKEEETEGKLIYELGNKQWGIPELRRMLETILPEKESLVDFEVTHTFENIGERTMLLNAKAIQREDRSKNLILLAIEDITEIKKIRLKEQEHFEKFKNLVMQAPVAIMFLKGENYNVELANDAYLQLVEKDKGIVGRPIFEALPEFKDQGIKAVFDTVMETGEPYHGSELAIKIKRKNKAEQGYYNFVYQPMRDQDIPGIMVISTEVTEQVVARKQMEESAHRYHELIHSTSWLIAILKGEKLIIEEVNDALLKVWGKEKDVIGKPILEILPEMEAQGIDKLYLDVYRTGDSYRAHEMPIEHHHDGKVILGYFDLIFQPQRNAKGFIEGVAIIATDVTPQAVLHDKLKQSEARFHQLTDLVPDMITNAAVKGEVFYFNKLWTDYSGWTTEKIRKEGWTKLVHPDEVSLVEHNWQQAVETGNDFEMELRILNKNGDYKWHISRSVPMKDEKGRIIMWVGAHTEIQKIKEEEQRKEDFLKMASHELKTPVTSIKGYTQLLLSMLKSGDKPNFATIPLIPGLERIDNQVSRLTRLISEMLDLSRTEESQLVLQLETFSMNALVEQSVQDIRYSHDEYKINIVHDDRFNVKGDKDRINQVLINFITNAIKYSPNDKNIIVRVYKKDADNGAVSVKDKGIGIDKKDHAHIFKRFYRVSGKNETTYSGFGIGLYLAKEIVERHQGQVAVKSKKDKGSEFTFILPIEKNILKEKNEENFNN